MDYVVYNPREEKNHLTILFIHGTPGNKTHADVYCESLIAAGYTVIAWSRPGYGETPLSTLRNSFMLQAIDIVALLEGIGITGNVVLYGASSGVPIALEICSLRRQLVVGAILESGLASPYHSSLRSVYQMVVDYLSATQIGNRLMMEIADRSIYLFTLMYLYRYGKYTYREAREEALGIVGNPALVGRLKRLLKSIEYGTIDDGAIGNDEVHLGISRHHLLYYVPDNCLILHGINDGEVDIAEAELLAKAKVNCTYVKVLEGSHVLPLSTEYKHIDRQKLQYVDQIAKNINLPNL